MENNEMGMSEVEMLEFDAQIRIAVRIDEMIRAKGWSKSEFAAKVGKKSSEISRWLSGAQNLTTRTLVRIAYVLCITLEELVAEEKENIEVLWPHQKRSMFEGHYKNLKSIPSINIVSISFQNLPVSIEMEHVNNPTGYLNGLNTKGGLFLTNKV